MVLAMRVLCRTGLAGHLDARQIRLTASTAQYGHPHTFGHILVVLTTDFGSMFLTVFGINGTVSNLLHHVRRIEPSAIGDSGAEIGYLEGSGQDLALSDRYRDNRVGRPVGAPELVAVELGVRNKATGFRRQIYSQLVTVSHVDHIVVPLVELVGMRLPLPVDHVP